VIGVTLGGGIAGRWYGDLGVDAVAEAAAPPLVPFEN
jgi:hypothetical protein